VPARWPALLPISDWRDDRAFELATVFIERIYDAAPGRMFNAFVDSLRSRSIKATSSFARSVKS